MIGLLCNGKGGNGKRTIARWLARLPMRLVWFGRLDPRPEGERCSVTAASVLLCLLWWRAALFVAQFVAAVAYFLSMRWRAALFCHRGEVLLCLLWRRASCSLQRQTESVCRCCLFCLSVRRRLVPFVTASKVCCLFRLWLRLRAAANAIDNTIDRPAATAYPSWSVDTNCGLLFAVDGREQKTF